MLFRLLLSVLSSLIFHEAISQKLLQDDLIIIPVVVHIVYNSPDQNITEEQVLSQISVLNADYRKKNRDASNIPAAFRDIAADSRIEFRLATIDPLGLPTSGIIRKMTSVSAFYTDDKVKSALTGGSDAWNRDEYLNIWVCNLANGIMGYASQPGCSPEKDGVVIRHSVFGTTANVKAPYNRGRTAVHEIGHWLGLKHIWGDKSCGDDLIDDTPPQEGPTRGCPTGVVSSCSGRAGGIMYMNFMDFTNDDCTNMFTAGQVKRMRAMFGENGARVALISSLKAVGAKEVLSNSSLVSFSIFPNPATDVLNIKFAESEWPGGRTIVIYNQLGQIVRKSQAKAATVQLNIRDLQNGMYYLSVDGNSRYRFIKTNH